MQDPKQASPYFRMVIIAVLGLGIFFRFFHLDWKVYWFDEVYSTTRTAGYSLEEIDQAVFQNQIIAAAELQRFQQPEPGSTVVDTVQVLIQEDAKHPPLYYVLANIWMRQVGSSITASRLLPALLSVLAFPFMFGLAMELFATRTVAYLAVALLALSPFDILFAQTVRQYSLLTLAILSSSFFFYEPCGSMPGKRGYPTH